MDLRTDGVTGDGVGGDEPAGTTSAGAPSTAGTDEREPAGWQLLRRALLEERRGLVIGVVASLLWTAARVAVPWLVQLAIDRSISGPDRAWPWAVAVASAGVVSGVFLGVRRYVAFDNARKVEARYRSRLFAHIQRLHVAFHDVTATGELMSRANTDLQMFQNVVTMVPITVGNALIVVAAVGIMTTISPTLTLVAVAGLPVVNVVGRRFSQRLHPAVLGVQRESAELAGVVEETVSGIRAVKGFGAEEVQKSKLATEADDVRTQALLAASVRARYLPLIELMPNLGLVGVLAYGGWLVIEGRLTVGELVGFNLYVGMLIQPLRMLGMVVAQGQRAVAAGERIAEVLDTDPEITDPPRPTPLARHQPGETGAIEFRNVVFGYRSHARAGDPGGLPVLEGLDLDIAPGESVALVGPTGGGKSTIARLLPRFYDVEDGAILLDGVDLRQLRLSDLRRAVGLVFQETFLFSGSIADNIGFADPDAGPERIRRAARLAGALDFVEALPDGFDTELGERGLSLSGGQRQRLAIARALVADPRVLILDDATSAVDPDTEHEIREAMTEVMSGRTTIVIAHRPATIALADRVVLLDEGRIVAGGTHAELLAGSERYRAILATEAEVG